MGVQQIFLNERAASGLPPYRVWTYARRRELMQMVAAGVPRKVIAERINVSVQSVNGMVFRIRHGLPVGPAEKLRRPV